MAYPQTELTLIYYKQVEKETFIFYKANKAAMIKAIIFDHGGVIKENSDDIIFRDFALAFSLPLQQMTRAIQRFLDLYQTGEISDEKFFVSLSALIKKPLPKNYRLLWTAKYGAASYNEGTIHFIEQLKQKGYKLACLSNTIPPHAEFSKKKHGYHWFDVVVLSCEVGLRKPDKRIYELTCKELRCKPQECLFIDDSFENLAPAKELGMETIQFKSEDQLRRELLHRGIAVR